MEVLPSFQAREKGPAGSLTLLFWSFKLSKGSEYLGGGECLCMNMYSKALYEILHRWLKMQFHFPGDVPNSFQLTRKPTRGEGVCILSVSNLFTFWKVASTASVGSQHSLLLSSQAWWGQILVLDPWSLSSSLCCSFMGWESGSETRKKLQGSSGWSPWTPAHTEIPRAAALPMQVLL